jgi:hypothetical protein
LLHNKVTREIEKGAEGGARITLPLSDPRAKRDQSEDLVGKHAWSRKLLCAKIVQRPIWSGLGLIESKVVVPTAHKVTDAISAVSLSSMLLARNP